MRSILFYLAGFAISATLLLPLFALTHGVPSVRMSDIVIVVGAFVISIPVHETIHGITCAYVSDNNYKSISYGISPHRFCAFCRYSRPVEASVRYWASLMPCIVLAVIPAVVAVSSGWTSVLLFAILNFGVASSDIHKSFTLYKQQNRKK